MTPKRILIADDSNTARGVLAKFFAQRDFDVCEAVDGEDTIEKARKLKPDLILLERCSRERPLLLRLAPFRANHIG